jgi:hypothetical protein
VLLISDWADQNWMQVSFPTSIRRKRQAAQLLPDRGRVLRDPAMDRLRRDRRRRRDRRDTPDAAIAEVKRICELVEGHLLDKPVDALDIAREQLEKVLGPDKPTTKAGEAHRAAGLTSCAISDSSKAGDAWRQGSASAPPARAGRSNEFDYERHHGQDRQYVDGMAHADQRTRVHACHEGARLYDRHSCRERMMKRRRRVDELAEGGRMAKAGSVPARPTRMRCR